MDLLDSILMLQEKYDDPDVVVKASDIKRPQSALDREMFEDAKKRFNQADGGRAGMLKGGLLSKGITKALEQIKNMDETNVFSKLNPLGKAKTIRDALIDRIKGFKNIIKDLKKEGRPIDEIEDFKFEMDEAKDSLEKINEYIKNQPTNRTLQAQGGRIELSEGGGKAFRLKKLQEDYNTFGKKELDKGARTLGFKNYASMSGEKFSNKRKKIRKELREFGEVMTEAGSRQRSRVGRIQTEQDIQIKLLEETNNKKFFDPKKFAKDNNISLLKLKKQAALLQKNIYNKRMKIAGKDMRFQLNWIPDDPTVSDNALNKLWKSKLIKYDKNKIDELFYQSFGNPKSNTYNPKKFLAIKKNLNEYRQLRDAINAKYPNINFELDHPLSKSSLNKIFNATTDQLTRVNVLESDLNNGFKDSLSLQYEKAVQDNNLNKKKAVEKIARDLKLNIGKISDDATNFKYGVKEFQKLNMKNEIAKSLENLQFLNKNFKTYAKNNPELFKTAGVSTQQTFTKIDNVKGLSAFMKNLGIKCRLANGVNCNMPQAYEKSLNELSTKAQAGDQAAAAKITNFTKSVRGAGNIIKGTLGPAALLVEAGLAVPIGLFEYAQGKPATEIVDSLTYGLFGKSREDRLRELDPTYGAAENLQNIGERLTSLERLQKGTRGQRIRSKPQFEKTTEQFETAAKPFLDTGDPQKALLENIQKSQDLKQKLIDEDLQRKEDRTTQFDLSNPFMAAGGGIAKEAGDSSGRPPESGPNSRGLQGLMKRVKNL